MEIKVLRSVLASNERIACENRRMLDDSGTVMVNIMGSPGSGKTALIECTLERLKDVKVAVVEGDIETTLDAERLGRFKVPVVQINTGPLGGQCHLDASHIREALEKLDLKALELVFIENVGNLVCPAEFDTGAHYRVATLSTPEGHDKPLKYPLMFRTADLVVVTKADLAEAAGFSMDMFRENLKKVSSAPAIVTSVRTGEGVTRWVDWIKNSLVVLK